jgi:hypothetical protein
MREDNNRSAGSGVGFSEDLWKLSWSRLVEVATSAFLAIPVWSAIWNLAG